MKILMLAPVHRERQFLLQKGKYPFLVGQAQQSWYEAFKDLGHNVKVFRYSDSILMPNVLRIYIADFFITFFPIWKGRVDRYSQKFNLFALENAVKNKKFSSIIKEYRPDLILVSGGLSGINPNALIKSKKKLHFRAILESGVDPHLGASRYERELAKRQFFDYTFVNDKGNAQAWEKLGAKNVIALPLSSVDPRLHKKYKLSPEEINKYACDVCFVGSLHENKQKILEKLTVFNLKVWGDIPPGVKVMPALKKFYKGRASSTKMVKIFNCAKIVVNIHPEHMKYGGNMRTFEIPGSGAFQLVDRTDSRWFIPGKEVVVFKNSKDLVAKVKYYLAHEELRKEIAENGYKRSRKNHTYKIRFRELIRYVFVK